MTKIMWTKVISPPEELEGGVRSAPNFNFTSQGARRAPIWWPKATSPPQELERGSRSDPKFLVSENSFCSKLEGLAP